MTRTVPGDWPADCQSCRLATVILWYQDQCLQRVGNKNSDIMIYQVLPLWQHRIMISNKFSRTGELLFVPFTKFYLKSRQTFIFFLWRWKSLEQNNKIIVSTVDNFLSCWSYVLYVCYSESAFSCFLQF